MSNNKVRDFRYDAKRKNNPAAGNAAQGKIPKKGKIEYAYNPHLPPVLRFDQTGKSDRLPELIEKATRQPLSPEEARVLTEALQNHEPYLEWTGKREAKSFEVDPVALHIHERISAQAILKVLQKESVQRDLFADPKQTYAEAVQFYQHDVEWANRLILGDSLQVMASLSRREDLAGKVQMIYFDPPYGIKFGSNFQPEIGKRDVKDKPEDLTRESEVVKAYRDTWHLGIHSYLSYLRDRLILAKELLHDSGSIFVQISDENLHRVRNLLDEVFEAKNFISQIDFVKTSGLEATGKLSTAYDYLLWYGRNRNLTKYKQIFIERDEKGDSAAPYSLLELPDGIRRSLTKEERESTDLYPEGSRRYRIDNLTKPGPGSKYEFEYHGRIYEPGKRWWGTTPAGMQRLADANRLVSSGNGLYYARFWNDFSLQPIKSLWSDTATGGFVEEKLYVVQTNTKVIQRCMLMTTEPGDLVLDPTCGSGTTAYVAEQWGRRWITIDSSRVAIALARQRLVTASYPAYKTKLDSNNPSDGFIYKTVPRVTLGAIAQNTVIDLITEKHKPVLEEKLKSLNSALETVSSELRTVLKAKLTRKEKEMGKRFVSDTDRRRWLLPDKEWKEWEVPFDTDEDWTNELKTSLNAYRATWREKIDEINAVIAANAEQEELVDKPEIIKNVVRVSGAFTVESVMPLETSLGVDQSLTDQAPIEEPESEIETFEATQPVSFDATNNAESYLEKMMRLLIADGVRFPNNKVAKFMRLDFLQGNEFLNAEGEWEGADDEPRFVAVSFGPENGPVTAYQVENALRLASRRGFDELVFAGFSFDAAAQAAIQSDPNPNVRCHLAHIRPDVQMQGLLKETPNSQIFTVFGSPRTSISETNEGYVIKMEGVDIYNPVTNTINPTNADKVAAWFLDADYDGRTFCITQAFFPDKDAWKKLKNALKGTIDETQFDLLTKIESLPFPLGPNKTVAVKVIDPRGNEVMSVHQLN